MEDLEYIKKFSKITIKGVCEKAKVPRQNIVSGKASKKKINKVRRQIENEIATLYMLTDNSEGDNNAKNEKSL